MDSLDGRKKKRTRRTINLCRICLTHSPSMKELSDNMGNIHDGLTIQEIIEKVMCCEVVITKESPNQVCSVCLSLLGFSYNLRKQFERSQKKLFGTLRRKSVETGLQCPTEVELIVGNNNYNLDDLVIVEDVDNHNEITNANYSEFLNKLGKTVSVEYLGKTPNEKTQTNTVKAVNDKTTYENDARVHMYTSDDISTNPFEDEQYETIIIKFESDTEEKYANEKSQSSPPLTISRNACRVKNANFLIEDEGGKQQILMKGKIKTRSKEVPDVITPNQKTEGKKKDIPMKEIEKFIIYQSDDEDEQQILTEDEIKIEGDENLDLYNTENAETAVKKEDSSNLEEFEKIGKTGEKQNLGEEIITNGRLSDGSTVKQMTERESKKKEKTATLEDIEKFIIYKTDDEDREQSDGTSISDTRENPEDVKNLEEHISHYCKACSMSFKEESMYKRHLLHEHGMKVVKTPTKRNKRMKLSKEIRMKRRIQRLKERFLKNPMLCQICGYVSKSSGGAKYHSLTHGEKMYKCDLCPKKFYTPSHLKNHFQNKHEMKTTSHLCSICGEHRNSKTALAYHMKLHMNNPKSYSCPICDVSFLMKSGLNNHLRRHMGDRRFPCNICDRSFFSSNERKKHMMIHTGERPHKCKYCERRFVTSFNKKIHMMTHDGPFYCKVCMKGLADEDLLKLHIKSKHYSSTSYKALPSEGVVDNVILEDLNLLDIVEDFVAD